MRPVTIYTRAFCGYCARALSLLSSKGVAFKEIDAGADADAYKEMVQRAKGGRTYPQIFIGDTHVGGSDELHELERAGKLDPMLQD